MTEQSPPEHWACLAGGNALGIFQAGAIEALLDADVRITRVAGTSIGAVTAALWFGGPAESAAHRLRTYWERATENYVVGGVRAARRAAASRALVGGQSGLFRPSLPGFFSATPMAPPVDHLHSTAPMRRTLEELVDFDRLNDGRVRVIVNALDQQTAEEVVFDSARVPLTVDHVMASSALPLLFPPVEIDGRALVDAGLSANLPIAALFADPPQRDTVCWAIDLWPPVAERATSLEAVARRQNDLIFAAQSKHALQRVAETVAPVLQEAGVRAAVHHLGYDGGTWEIGTKAFDYSSTALQRRARAGRAAMDRALAGPSALDGAGLHLVRHPFHG